MEQPYDQDNESGAARSEQDPTEVVARIYVASLSDYNAGHLHGAWVDATQDEEQLWEAVNEMLAASREPHAEEFAIFDNDGFWPLRLGEYDSLAHVSHIARGIAEHGPAFAHFANLDGVDLASFEDRYIGHYEDLETYGESVLDEFGFNDELEKLTPDLIAPYVSIDVEAFARDMELSDIIATSAGDNGIYVFHGDC